MNTSPKPSPRSLCGTGENKGVRGEGVGSLELPGPQAGQGRAPGNAELREELPLPRWKMAEAPALSRLKLSNETPEGVKQKQSSRNNSKGAEEEKADVRDKTWAADRGRCGPWGRSWGSEAHGRPVPSGARRQAWGGGGEGRLQQAAQRPFIELGIQRPWVGRRACTPLGLSVEEERKGHPGNG